MVISFQLDGSATITSDFIEIKVDYRCRGEGLLMFLNKI
jgi:hypothetical protein